MTQRILIAAALGGALLIPAVALATTTQITAAGDFPAPSETIVDFSAAEFAAYGVTGSGYSSASTSLVGNTAAPLSGNGGAFSSFSNPTFVFANPVLSVGFSIADIDYGNDNPLTVTLVGLDDAGLVVAGPVSVNVPPANSADEQNRGARFLGMSSDVAFDSVQISASTSNNTFFDNMMFEEEASGPGCNSAPATSGASLLGALALGLGLFLRPRRRE